MGSEMCIRDRIGTRNLAGWLVVGYLPCLPLFEALDSAHPSMVFVTTALVYVMFVSTAMWMLIMQERLSWSSQHQAATDFSIQASVANLGEWIGATIAGVIAATLGWTWFFYVGWSVAALAGLAFLLIITPVKNYQSLVRTE